MTNPSVIGQRLPRVDAPDKVKGSAKYTADLRPANALVAKVLHSTIANGRVTSMDVSVAAALPGVIKIVTCFDVPERPFPTAGHPWALEEGGQDIADRLLLNKRVRYWGDDIAAVVAVDELSARRALDAIKVEYEQFPAYVTMEQALSPDAQPLHPEICPTNVLKETGYASGDIAALRADETLVHLRKTYIMPPVQQCHIESAVSYAYAEGDKMVVVSSTQIPHIMRRVVGQALGLPWGQVRVIKPVVGGGFGNKQDVLYEPLNAYLSQLLGGRCVFMELTREEVFVSTRQRHAIVCDCEAWADSSGRLLGRSIDLSSQQGAYASHGHSIAGKAATYMREMYQDEQALSVTARTVYTNTGAAGAMRGYGIPQACFITDCLLDDLALKLNIDPIVVRERNMMPADFVDAATGVACNSYGLAECIKRGRELFDWEAKRADYAIQDGPLRRGVGMAIFSYKAGVYPLALETASCRMVLNQDGSVQLHLGATEIGQGGDTVFSQMAAASVGVPFVDVHIVSTQDTDVAPFDTGAYASRQTYVTGKAIKQTGEQLRKNILDYAARQLSLPALALDLREGGVYKRTTNQHLLSLADLAQQAFYSREHTQHLTAETTCHCTDNTYAFGCCFAEVEVDMPLGRVRVLRLLNVHDSGTLINPALAEAQVHGGMAMGLGYALSEEMLYDEQGRLLNGNLLDYKLPTALDVPKLEAAFVETYDMTGPFGNKALGEPPSVPVAPAIRNAVLQATGVAVDQLPLSPKRLVALFKERGLI